MTRQIAKHVYVGAAMMVVGGLMTMLSAAGGLLLVSISVEAMPVNDKMGGDLTFLFGLVTVVAGAPLVLGVLIYKWGWRMYRPVAHREEIEAFSDHPDDVR